jgi:hypothetical protein
MDKQRQKGLWKAHHHQEKQARNKSKASNAFLHQLLDGFPSGIFFVTGAAVRLLVKASSILWCMKSTTTDLLSWKRSEE